MIYSFEYCIYESNFIKQVNFIPIPSVKLSPKLSALELISLICKNTPSPFYAFFVTAGRRLLMPWMELDKAVHLLSGRRIRIYHALKKNNKLMIKFGWIKLAQLNKHDLEELKQIIRTNISDLWLKNGQKFITQVGGSLFANRLLMNFQISLQL